MRCMYFNELIDTLAFRDDRILIEFVSGGVGAVLARSSKVGRPIMAHKFLIGEGNEGLQTGEIDWICLEEEAFPTSELDELVFQRKLDSFSNRLQST